MNTFVTFRVIFFACLITLALGPVCLVLARRLGLVDVPGAETHKQHSHSVPVAGGLVLFSAALILSLTEGVYRQGSIPAILLSGGVIFIFGLLDDAYHLPPLWKLAGQLLASAALIALGVHVRIFSNPWLDYPLTVFWMVGITNAYNFVDSMDGLALGLAGMASAFFMLVSIDSGQGDLSLFSTILLGACLGSYYFNTSPAYYFVGDSGAQYLGFCLAALAIAYDPVGFEQLASWYVPILLVGVPIFDTTLVVISRLRRGVPVYKGAMDHTYHRLVALGMSSNRAVTTMHIAALLLGCLAFIALSLPPLIANLIFAAVLALGVVALVLLERSFAPAHREFGQEEKLREHLPPS
jgi:UDP-GlcNAc:undecaprenyl-phosphate GlcNAc-1-phosphate transferase